jgi:uncharacterized membrane protein YccC
VLGTIVGLGVAAVILASNPSTGVIVGLAIAFQMSAELLVGRNYAPRPGVRHPLAILMVELASPQRPGVLLRDRILETIIGALCGIAVTLFMHPVRRDDTRIDRGASR